MYWIYDYPSWVIGLLFCGTFVAFTWIGIFLTRATVHSWLHQEKRANEMVSVALSSYFVLFGLLLGLLAVATYQNYAKVSDIVDDEASSLAALYREISSLPEPSRGQLQQRLREYTRYTIEEGWAQQRKGIVPKGEAVPPACSSEVCWTSSPATKEKRSSMRMLYGRAFTEMSSVGRGFPMSPSGCQPSFGGWSLWARR